ncbi:hypothetical protein LOAG_11442 [Loa loa]|uniref:Uncharacterized protein n=1 Tax=Loa loa TaxID=7209 RepID=A0A1S0TNJ6_LOALO|nr:hypothetical protein LOAG_11442 [Loa loa]EFO17062.1 hypothetical protein LOAG_11442 [Loa loa]
MSKLMLISALLSECCPLQNNHFTLISLDDSINFVDGTDAAGSKLQVYFYAVFFRFAEYLMHFAIHMDLCDFEYISFHINSDEFCTQISLSLYGRHRFTARVEKLSNLQNF